MKKSLFLLLSLALLSPAPSCAKLRDLLKVNRYSLVLEVAEKNRPTIGELEQTLTRRFDDGGVRSSFTRKDLPGSKGILLSAELKGAESEEWIRSLLRRTTVSCVAEDAERYILSGKTSDARLQSNYNGSFFVSFSLKNEFHEGFYQYTLAHLNQRLDLMQDDRLIISATLQAPIPAGMIQLVGAADDEETFKQAARALRDAYIPCPFEIVSLTKR